jgi:hypothetical protein
VAVLKSLHQSKKLNRVSEKAEILYRRLLEVVDDQGNYYASPGLILGYVFAHRMDSGAADVDDIKSRRQELLDERLVALYGEDEYLHIVNHYTKFRADRKTADVRFPSHPKDIDDPPTERARNGHVTDTELAGNAPAPYRPEQTRQDKTRTERGTGGPSDEGTRLASLAYDLILPNHSNVPSFKKFTREHLVTSWASTIDRFLKATGNEPADIDRFFRWLAQDVEVNPKPRPGRKPWVGWQQQFQSVNILDNDYAWASFSRGSMSQGYVHRSKR